MEKVIICYVIIKRSVQKLKKERGGGLVRHKDIKKERKIDQKIWSGIFNLFPSYKIKKDIYCEVKRFSNQRFATISISVI